MLMMGTLVSLRNSIISRGLGRKSDIAHRAFGVFIKSLARTGSVSRVCWRITPASGRTGIGVSMEGRAEGS